MIPTGRIRPIVTKKFRKLVFAAAHALSLSGYKKIYKIEFHNRIGLKMQKASGSSQNSDISFFLQLTSI